MLGKTPNNGVMIILPSVALQSKKANTPSDHQKFYPSARECCFPNFEVDTLICLEITFGNGPHTQNGHCSYNTFGTAHGEFFTDSQSDG